MSSFKSLIVRFLTLSLVVASSICQGSYMKSDTLTIDFTKPKEVPKKAIWFPTDKLNINKQGLGWDADAAESRPGEIQTKPIALGHSWRTPSSIYVRVTILPPPKAILLNDGSMSTPYPGNMFVRYSPDLKNWSSWTILEHSYQKITDREKRNKRCYEGRIGIPQRNRNEYYKLLHNYSKLNVPWKSDEEAAVRWILKQQPKFFAKNIPFMGYIEFLFEGNFYGRQRIKSFKADVSYCIPGGHYSPKDKDIYNKRSEIPWRFKASPTGDSFEAVRKKLITKLEKEKVINEAEWEKISETPFNNCMNLEKPFAKGTFVYNMFHDKNLSFFSVGMITKYMKKNPKNHAKRQEILNFFLKNMTPKNPRWMRIGAEFILNVFKNKNNYNEESQKIIKDLLLKDGCDKYALFLIDRAGIYDDPEIITFLKEKAKPYKSWSWRNKTPWFALLILARNGDKNAIKKVIKLANPTNVKITDHISYQKRRNQVQLMPVQLAYVQQPEIVELLKKFLHIKESYFNGHDCVPQRSDLSHASARALSNMIEGYPKVNNWGYTKKLRKECIEWFDKHKKYKFNKNAKILYY